MADYEALSDTIRAYCAGLFDGEGCVYILNKHAKSRKGKRYRNHAVKCEVSSTNPNPLLFLRKHYEGHINPQKRQDRKKQQWRWMVSSRKAEEFLKSIQPFLIIKAPEVELALEFCSTCLKRDGGYMQKLTNEEVQIRESYKQRLSDLKKINWQTSTQTNDIYWGATSEWSN